MPKAQAVGTREPNLPPIVSMSGGAVPVPSNSALRLALLDTLSLVTCEEDRSQFRRQP